VSLEALCREEERSISYTEESRDEAGNSFGPERPLNHFVIEVHFRCCKVEDGHAQSAKHRANCAYGWGLRVFLLFSDILLILNQMFPSEAGPTRSSDKLNDREWRAFNKQPLSAHHIGNEPIENGEPTNISVGLGKFTVISKRLCKDSLASRIEISQR